MPRKNCKQTDSNSNLNNDIEEQTILLSEINENTSMNIIRTFIKQQSLSIKTSGKGISKKNIVKQIKKELKGCDNFTLQVAKVLKKNVNQLYCNHDLLIECRLQDPNGERRAFILDTLLTWNAIQANAETPADFSAVAGCRLTLPVYFPPVGAIAKYNFASPGVLCNIVSFMQDPNNWSDANQWGYRCGDPIVRPRFDLKIDGTTEWIKFRY